MATADIQNDDGEFELVDDGEIGTLSGDPEVPENSLVSTAVNLRGIDVTGLITQESIILPGVQVAGAIEAQGSLGRNAPILPGIRVSGSILYAGELNSLLVEVPAVRVSGSIAAERNDVNIPGVRATGSILNGSIASGAPQVPPTNVTGLIQFEGSDLAANDQTLPGITVSGTILAGANGDAAIAIAVSASGVILAGGILTGIAVLPGVSVTGSGYAVSPIASGRIEIPVYAVGSILAQAPLVTSGDALALNTRTLGLTRYTEFGFSSFACLGDRVYACNAYGVFELSGDYDQRYEEIDEVQTLVSDPIEARITTGHMQMDEPRLKRIASVVVGYRSSGPLRFYLRFDDSADTLYLLQETRASGVYRNRMKTGKGASGSYVQMKIENENGADFSIDAIEFEVESLRRRA